MYSSSLQFIYDDVNISYKTTVILPFFEMTLKFAL